MIYFRSPKTGNEMRQYYATTVNEIEVAVKVRGKRRPKYLPNAWDDIFRGETKNWKAYRRCQWKTKKGLTP